MYSVLRYFGTRVPIVQYSSVLGTHTFKKYLYSYLYSSTFKNESTFNEYLRLHSGKDSFTIHYIEK